jgi:hypothetical protein
MVERLDFYKNTEKGVRNLRFFTTLVPRRHVMATCFA